MTLKLQDDILLKYNNFTIKDSKDISSLKVKIEASHAGVINKNDVFYTPKSLRQGSDTLVNPYTKTLQRKHYNKSVGKIEKSYYVDTVNKNDVYYKAIEEAKTPADLVNSVNTYLQSSVYKNSNKKGLGALYIEGVIYDNSKIIELQDRVAGHVSIAGDSTRAFCSICAKTAGTCTHKPGSTYNRRKAFIIVDSSELDHVSFEEHPADDQTHTYILQDSEIYSSLDILDFNEKGQNMKLTLDDLKQKLSDTSSLFTEFNIKPELELKDSEFDSDYLVDNLLPLTTPQALYIASKLVLELQDSEDKDFLTDKVTSQIEKVLEGKTLEEIEPTILAVTMTEDPIVEPVVEEPVVAAPVDSTKEEVLLQLKTLATQLSELSTSVLSLKDSTAAKQSTLAQKELATLRSDSLLKDKIINSLTAELKTAILDQVITKIKDSAKKDQFLSQVADKSLAEVKTAIAILDCYLEDTPVVEPEQKPIAIQDNALNTPEPELEPVPVATAILDSATKTEEELAAEEKNKVVESYVEKLEIKDSVLSRKSFETTFKEIVRDHGLDMARNFSNQIKDKKYSIK